MDSPGRYWLVTKNPSFKRSPSQPFGVLSYVKSALAKDAYQSHK
jgi:hypothetical protein